MFLSRLPTVSRPQQRQLLPKFRSFWTLSSSSSSPSFSSVDVDVPRKNYNSGQPSNDDNNNNNNNGYANNTAEQDAERPRRCLLSVPGSDARKIAKAKTIGADAVVLDLEDGVALDQKDMARELVRTTLLETSENEYRSSFGSSELCVRINGLETNDVARKDLEAILPCPALQAIVVPKVECEYSISYVNDQIEALGANPNIRILAAIESASGMVNIRDIATSGEMMSRKRLDALIFASEDYCADLELIRTESAIELLYARQTLVTMAKAYKLQAIDMVHIDYNNMIGLNVECQRGREMGFTGKQAIHPNQVDTIQKAFVPAKKDITFAVEVVEQYEAVTTNGNSGGSAACVVQGIVVDAPVYKWALKILKRASKAGMLEGS